jgi:hypothetical protein
MQLLVAPFPALSGDGQLRELMLERRRHQGIGEAGLWYCPPNLSSMLGVVGRRSGIDQPVPAEGIAILDPRVAVWLQLRLGGALRPMLLSSAWLMSEAIDLPFPAPLADLAWIS